MKTKKGFNLRTLGKEYILVAEGLEAANANRMISMNETAAFLWQQVEHKDFDAPMLVDLLVEHYDVTAETAEKDVAALLQTWREADIIED